MSDICQTAKCLGFVYSFETYISPNVIGSKYAVKNTFICKAYTLVRIDRLRLSYPP